MLTKIPLGRLMTNITKLGQTTLAHQQFNPIPFLSTMSHIPNVPKPIVPPHITPVPVFDFGKNPLSELIKEEQKRKTNQSDLWRAIDVHAAEGRQEAIKLMEEQRKNSKKNPIEQLKEEIQTKGKDTQAKEEPVKAEEGPVQEANEPSVQIDSSKKFQEEVFKLARKEVENNSAALLTFNLFENTVKKITMPVFDGLYPLLATKEGIPEETAKAVLDYSKWIVLALLVYALYDEYKKKMGEAKGLDDTLCSLYKEAEKLAKDTNGIAQRCTMEAIARAGLQNDLDLNNNILRILDECAKSNNDPTGILHSFKIFLQDQTASISLNKPIDQAREDNKVIRELYRRQHNQDGQAAKIATNALNSIGPTGVVGAKNNLTEANERLKSEIDNKKQLIDQKEKQIETREQQIGELTDQAEKKASALHSKLVTQVGLFSPNYSKCQENYRNSKGLGNVEDCSDVKKDGDDFDTLTRCPVI